jgi:SPOR domain
MRYASGHWFKKAFSCHFMGVTFVLLLLLCCPTLSEAQENSAFEETRVTINAARIGVADISAIIHEQDAYLSVSDLFTFLKIQSQPSAGMDSLTGIIQNQNDPYFFDIKKRTIAYQKKLFDLNKGDLIRTETSLYLKSNYYGEIFGLYCTFDFRSLSVSLNTKIELPIFREMRQEVMRNNVNRLKGNVKVDSIIPRSYQLFKPGTLDWSFSSAQQSNGQEFNRLSFNTGAAVAGGTTELGLNFQTNYPLNLEDQHFLWKYANNDTKGFRQAILGVISAQTISSIFKPVVGFQLTNTPTTFRRSFGSYKLSETTQPNWIVELYVNGIMVDYTKADASGLFTFDIPMVYGNSDVSLRFYGPWGEEQERKMNISIPFNFLPVKQFEYVVSAGLVGNDKNKKIAKTQFSYGLSQRATIGGGVEYLSSIQSNTTIPYLNGSFRLGSKILLSGEFDYKTLYKTTLSYNIPSGFQIEMRYTNFEKGQKVLYHNYLEERNLSFSLPVRNKKFALFSRVSLNQILMPEATNTSGVISFSSRILGISNNFTTYSIINDQKFLKTSNTNSTLSQTFRLPARSTFTQRFEYGYDQKRLSIVKFEIDKPIFKKAYINLSFENNFRSKIYETAISFRYDFSFAQTSFSARVNKNRESVISESASGSFYFDSKYNYLGTSNRNCVDKGGIVLIPFLDLNLNNKYDKGEPKVKSLKLSANAGRLQYDNKDTVIRITDLEPYTHYIIELNRNSLDNIAWQLKNASLSIAVDPNIIKVVEIPITVTGEVSGMVYSKSENGKSGLGRINIQFARNNGTIAGTTLSESDGYFSYLGLNPGKYNAKVDSVQMRNIEMISQPNEIPFSIKANMDGDFLDGLEFTLEALSRPIKETPQEIFKETLKLETPIANNITPIIRSKELQKTLYELNAAYNDGCYFVQVGAYKHEAVARKVLDIFNRHTTYPVTLVYENRLFKVRAGYFKSLKEANACYRWMQVRRIDKFQGTIIYKNSRMRSIIVRK